MPKVQAKPIIWCAYVANIAHPQTEKFKLSLETQRKFSALMVVKKIFQYWKSLTDAV